MQPYLLGYATIGGSEVLLQGLTLTIVGMGVVFIFLTILVIVMQIISAFIPKYFPDDNANKKANTKQSKKESIKTTKNLEENALEALPLGEAEIAAVIAAVKSFSHI
jgi:sodium pump decarboxylase gamma subunit